MWLPYIAFGVARADMQRRAAGDPPAQLLAGLALGMGLWQVLEYVLHRFVFHYEPSDVVGITVRVFSALPSPC